MAKKVNSSQSQMAFNSKPSEVRLYLQGLIEKSRAAHDRMVEMHNRLEEYSDDNDFEVEYSGNVSFPTELRLIIKL